MACSSPFDRPSVRPIKSVTRDQCDARATVTLTTAERHCLLTSARLYCSVTRGRRVRYGRLMCA